MAETAPADWNERQKWLRRLHVHLNASLKLAAEKDITEEDGEGLAAIVNEAIGLAAGEIDNIFLKGRTEGGFLDDSGTQVFRNLRRSLDALRDLIPHLSNNPDISTLDRNALIQLFVTPEKVDPALLRSNEFGTVLSHIQECSAPKILLERLGEAVMYFRHGAYEEDLRGHADLARAKRAMDVAQDGSPQRAPAETTFAAVVMEKSAARCIPVVASEIDGIPSCRWENGAIWTARNGTAPPGYLDRVMRVPGGIAIGHMTTDGGWEMTATVSRLTSQIGSVCSGMEIGVRGAISSANEIVAIDFFSTSGAVSWARFDEHAKLAQSGIHIERSLVLSAVAWLMKTNNAVPFGTGSRVAFHGVLCDSIEQGRMAFSEIGSTLSDELTALASDTGLGFLTRDPEVKRHVKSLIVLLASPGPKQLGLLNRDKDAILQALDKFPPNLVDAGTVYTAKTLLSAYDQTKGMSDGAKAKADGYELGRRDRQALNLILPRELNNR